MANPFLMDDEPLAGSEPTPNPFLFGDDGGAADGAAGDESDNPFLAQAGRGSNPFAFGGEDDEEMPSAAAVTSAMDLFGSAPDPVVVTSGAQLFLASDHIMTAVAPSGGAGEPAAGGANANFFHTTINEEDDLIIPKPTHLHLGSNTTAALMDPDGAASSEDELTRGGPPRPHKPVPPRPIPPSTATQQLISSIADQLDQTSTNLLQKIPVTRTPSPVSMRDLHSPSPTPADYGELAAAAADNPFADHDQPPVAALSGSVTPVQKPPRPRPPPPRPAPPRSSVASSPVAAQPGPAPPQEPDLFDLFGTVAVAAKPAAPPKPPAPKTKEDILSLFSQPAQPTTAATAPRPSKPDLLSDDLDDFLGGLPGAATGGTGPEPAFVPNLAENLATVVQPIATVQAPAVAAVPPPKPPPPAIVQQQQQQQQVEEPLPAEEEAPPEEPECFGVEPSPEIVLEVAPASDPSDQLRSEVSSEYSPTGSNITSGNIPSSVSGSIVNLPTLDRAPVEMELDGVAAGADSDYDRQQVEEQHAALFAAEPLAPVTAQHYYGETTNPADQLISGGTNGTAATVNPFAMVDEEEEEEQQQQEVPGVVHVGPAPGSGLAYANELFGATNLTNNNNNTSVAEPDAFDSFAAKFEGKQSGGGAGDFGGLATTGGGAGGGARAENIFLDDGLGGTGAALEVDAFGGDAWGTGGPVGGGGGGGFDEAKGDGFGNEDGFDDPFLSMQAPPAPEGTPFGRSHSRDSDEGGREFNVVIRPKEGVETHYSALALAPPPKSPQTASIYSGDSSPRVNPFERSDEAEPIPVSLPDKPQLERTDSQETPPTPLFDEDVSQPLEDFPRVIYHGDGWEMQLRQPNKKKITGQRFWKKIYIRLVYQGDSPVLQLLNAATDKEPFQELPLQACYSVSEIGAQQYDNFGKIFTIKLQYVFYKERPGVRPGQVTKAERLTNKLSQFAAYAIQGDYQGVKELGSDLKKLGLPVEHAPQISQLFKLGSMNYEDMKQFSVCIEEALFKMNVHRDRALTYKTEEVQVTAVDELYVEQDAEGHVMKQIARVRLFFLAFLTGMPDIELGVNDLWRQGKEVVGRHDIIPVVTEEWIRLEGVEFHSCVQQDEYERSRTIKFKPPDACYIELMRFRIRPPKNRELPLQLKATWCVTGNKVELRADVLVPGFASRKLGQIPCEDVSIRFPIPECWIYLFRVEKHFRYGSVKSAHRRTGKIKGIERILGTVDTLQESLIEVTSGQAKYEHHHRAIVWRCPRLPKEGQGAYTTHQLVCRMALTSFDQIPEQLAPYAYVEFTMPATQASHTTVRSVSVQDSESDEPPEKYVRYLARHEYRVGIEHTTGESLNPYLAATTVTKQPIQEEQPMATTPIAPSDSDSDSN
ncbi:AGAP000363-PA [Anopheles gambiae str. PEST]|uniref:AGAP000363-PA n=1 Tax=Anopheles gambiae TaxID=7165 RepID=Q7QF90_ANOGA|nr:AGAP000363-PA [Anopheles gambiae str. PEST]